MILLSDLKANPNNPRKISTEAFKKLKESILRDKEFMEIRPMIIDEDGLILGGNMRYKALIDLGYTEIPDKWVWNANNLTEDQKKRFIVIDNSPGGMSGEWDYELLGNDWDIEELENIGFNINDLIGESQSEEEANENIFEQSIQLTPQKEYIVIFANDAEEWEEMKQFFGLRQVRRGGYKEGSPNDAIGTERVLSFERAKHVSSNTK